MTIVGRTLLGGTVFAALALAAPASAQRDPAYDAARSAGQVGEKMDGYLGVVGSQSPAVERIASDINNRRRENYAQNAQQQRVTLQEYAFTQGCVLIGRLEDGLKYQAPDGSWKTKSGAAQRDPRCP